MENNTFKKLSQINVNEMVDKKQTGGTTLTYLSWASAFQVAKENYPDLEYEIERNPETGLPYWYDPLTGYMVFTKVTINGVTHEMWLPVMDGTNHAMKAEPYDVQTKYKKYKVPAATMYDINKAIMRCLVKNLSMFGLGLYIYRGEDLPDGESQAQNAAQPPQAQPANRHIEKAVPQVPAQSKAPVKDTRPVTPQMVGFIEKTIEEHQIRKDWICHKYKVSELKDLRVYQAKHIGKNISKLEAIFDEEKEKNLNEKKAHLADVVTKNADITVDPVAVMAGQREMPTTFADAICPPPQQKKTEEEEVSLESLGLSPADLDALTECGNVFS